MKVIKPGREQRGWSKEFTCTGAGNNGGGCGAVLLVEQPDLFHTYHCVRDETDVYTTFQCVQCGVLTDIPDPRVGKLPGRQEWLKDRGAS